MVSKAMDASLYDAHSLAQASLHTLASPMLSGAARAAAKAALQNSDRAIVMLVVGPATGVNDVAAIKKYVLPEFHAVAPSLPIRALFADLASNEWLPLMNEMSTLEGIECSATIGLAQKPIVAVPKSVHFVMCMSALHWITDLPWASDQSELGGAVSYVTLPPKPKADLRGAANAQLHSFFRERLKELAPDGQMVLTFDGETSVKTHQFALTYHLLEAGLKEMIADGKFPADLLTKYFIPTVPFGKEHLDGILAKEASGEVVESSFLDIPCPYVLAYNQDKDSTKCGCEVGNAIIACVKKQVKEALATCGVDENKHEALIAELQGRCAKIGAGSPEKYNTSGITAFLQVRKVRLRADRSWLANIIPCLR